MSRARRPDRTDEPVTAEEMQRARPLREAAPDLAAALEAHQRQTRDTQKAPLRADLSRAARR
jgi:hypothetical protein